MSDLLKHIKSYIWSKRNYKIFIDELFNKQSLKKLIICLILCILRNMSDQLNN